MIQLLKGKVLRLLFFLTILPAITTVGHSSVFTQQDTIRADTALVPGTSRVIDTTEVDYTLPPSSATPTMHSDHMLRGERLFYGLVYFADRAVNCAECHTTRPTKTLNWNPDAAEISIKYLNKSSDELEAVLLRPTGKKMAEAHASIDLTSQDVVMKIGRAHV